MPRCGRFAHRSSTRLSSVISEMPVPRPVQKHMIFADQNATDPEPRARKEHTFLEAIY